MKDTLVLLRRWLYVMLTASLAFFLLYPVVQRSAWHKNHLYARLLTGNHEQQLHAASALAYLGGQEQLLRALKSDNPSARELGRRALEYLWFNAAGSEAYQLLENAYRMAEQEQVVEALQQLNRLVQKYPKFAEGWNRRASVYWQMGEQEKSMADSERALALNPNHYGAWQGLGIAHLQKGNLSEACRCLRTALKIIPHDGATREALKKCENLQRVYPAPGKGKKPLDIV